MVTSQAHSQALYRWTDETGKIHIVDEMRRVPQEYRKGMKIYRPPSRPKKRRPVEKKEVSGPAVENSEEGEEPGTPAPTPGEGTARIEALQQREEELNQEKARLKVLETRFRTKRSRSNIYTRRIEELDQEIEAIHKELSTIRPKVP